MRALPSLTLSLTLLAPPCEAGQSTEPPLFGSVHDALPSYRTNPIDALLADVDGDGDLDLVEARPSAIGRLFLNDGEGVFADETAALPAAGAAAFVAAGDVNGDGELDLLFGVELLALNLGAGAWAAAPSAPGGSMYVEEQRDGLLADLDGDGDLDVAFAEAGPCEFYGGCQGWPNGIWLGNGGGGFQLPYYVGGGYSNAVAAGDVDGDGDLDLAYGNGTNWTGTVTLGHDSLYLNDGAALFSPAPAGLPSHEEVTTELAFADLDGDGDLDLWGANVGPDELYAGDGAGVFADASAQLPAVSSLYSAGRVALADVDGDLDLDAVVTGGALIENLGGLAFALAASQPPGPLTAIVLCGDVDGDGDQDLLNPSGPDGLRLNGGPAGWFDAAGPDPPEAAHRERRTAFGDLDGDGWPELVLARPLESDLAFTNDGTGEFGAALEPFGSSANTSADLALGDFDGDGDRDAFFARYALSTYSAQDALFLNKGGMSFADATGQIPVDAESGWACATADFDLDGDLDLFVGNSSLTHAELENDGTAHFQLGATVTGSTNVRDAAAGDTDGDGDADVAMASLNHGAVLLRNQGGTLAPVTLAFPGDLPQTYSIALGDADGDGDLDAAAGSLSSGLRAYANGGSGLFSALTLPAGHAEGAVTGIAFEDLDGVPGSEILAANDKGPNRLYRYMGGGFEDASHLLPPFDGYTSTYSEDVAAADTDGDCDLDVFLGASGNGRYWRNLSAQLARRRVASIGRPLTLEVRSAPGSWFLLAMALFELAPPVPLPPFGELRLDPAWLMVNGPLLIGADGAGSFAIDLPSKPGLVGFQAPWQAIAGFELELTNLERTLVTVF